MAERRVVISGASGLIGTALADSLLADGVRVIGSNGKVVTALGNTPRYGLNWTGTDALIQLRQGRGPRADTEIAMNAAAKAVVSDLPEITIAYGVSDEYRFIKTRSFRSNLTSD